MWGGGRVEDPKLLRHVRHEQRCQGDREDGGGHEDTHQRDQQGSLGHGGWFQM